MSNSRSSINATRGRARRWKIARRNRRTGKMEVLKEGYKVKEAKAYKKADPLNQFSNDEMRLKALKEVQKTKRLTAAATQANIAGAQVAGSVRKQVSSSQALQQSLSGGNQSGAGKNNSEEENEAQYDGDYL